MAAVVCKNLTKTFGEGATKVEALRGVDLEVNEGELLMIVGPSGSGKTTLISIIAGILSPSSGDCLIFGDNLSHFSDQERTNYRGAHIGFVFQSFNLISTLTAQENVAIPLILNGIPRHEALERAAVFLTDVGLGDRLHSYPKKLSGGQQQRVAIARGCIHNPKIIVCDEPTSALDAETGGKVLTILRDMVLKSDRVLIVVTHDARIYEFADRIVKVEDGAISN
ncbi:MAG: ABC transporter ATP-binding protein [Simkaniaceae bacterium]|nr:ABC transporter ATP-binding protein [Simkaniaceae bacterium]